MQEVSNPHENSYYLHKINRLESLLNRLNNIGIMLSAEKNTNKLLEMILKESMEITCCDAGSIYVKFEKDESFFLKFQATKNNSREFPFKEFHLPINTHSISGSCAYTGKSYNFKNMEDVSNVLGLQHNDHFDKQIHYKTVNMLVIPMKDFSGEIVGVLQLINKKTQYDIFLDSLEDFDAYIVPFTKEEEEIILSLASQTAILLERSKLHEEIQHLFECFIESMVTTIEQRDPTTSGHSIRVARYVSKLAKAVNEVNYGKYKDLCFSEPQLKELYYAGLLHDIGKIGVRERVLLKQNRLSDEELQTVCYRLHYMKKDLLLKKFQEQISQEEEQHLHALDHYCTFLCSINQKGFITDDEENLIRTIASITFTDYDDTVKNLLTENEVTQLIVKRGNLTDEERNQINLHVSYTYRVLKDIPWIKAMRRVPEIAAAHHEKLDGTGYPSRLTEEHISIQSRMLAIIDIFEALTAVDRPYKAAMPVDRALKILEEEAQHHHLDPDLFQIFMQEKVFEKCLIKN